MRRPLLALAAALSGLVASPVALGQSPYDCLSFPQSTPDPFPDPFPKGYGGYRQAGATLSEIAGPDPVAEEGTGAHVGGRRAHERLPAAACPTDERIRVWTGGEWQDSYRTTASYDAAGRLLSIVEFYDADGMGALEEDNRSAFAYNAEGLMTEYVYSHAGKGGPVTPAQRYTFGFDGQRRVVSILTETWDGSAWEYEHRRALTYGSGPYASGFNAEVWDGATWQPLSRRAYTYDGLLMTESVDDAWDGTAWAPSRRSLYTYTDGRLVDFVAERNAGSGLEPSRRQQFTYDSAGRVLTALYQQWEGAWTDTYANAYTYHPEGRLATAVTSYHGEAGMEPSERIAFTYSGAVLAEASSEFYNSGGWVPEGLTRYTHNGQGQATERLRQTWDGSAWQDSESGLFSYGAVVSTEDAPAAAALALSATPNPARGTMRVWYRMPAPAAVRLALYDVLGRRVAAVAEGARAAGPHAEALDVSRLAPGVYVLRLEAGAEAHSRRVTVVR